MRSKVKVERKAKKASQFYELEVGDFCVDGENDLLLKIDDEDNKILVFPVNGSPPYIAEIDEDDEVEIVNVTITIE